MVLVALALLLAVATAGGPLVGGEPPRDPNPPPSPVIGTPRAPPSEPPSEPEHGAEAEAELLGAEATARAFLDEYLPFAYGKGPLPQAALSRELREQLRSDYASGRARAPVAKRELRPEVTRLDLSGRDPATELEAIATVDDGGGTPYSFPLTLRRRDGAWQVTRLGGK